MKKLLMLFVLACGLALAQAPLAISGYAGAAGSAGKTHFNPGVSVALPFSPLTSLPVEWNHTPGTNSFLAGISHTVVGFNNYDSSISVAAQIGASRTADATKFISAYTLGYSKSLGRDWAIGPSIRYVKAGNAHAWCEGIGITYLWRR